MNDMLNKAVWNEGCRGDRGGTTDNKHARRYGKGLQKANPIQVWLQQGGGEA